MKVEGDDIVPARAAKELHRSRTWASDWLARYREEGIEGLRDRPKSGRPQSILFPDLNFIIIHISGPGILPVMI
jgi:transposase